MDTEARLGARVEGWTAPPRPDWTRREGRHVALERLDPARHAADLFTANQDQDWVWDYMPYGPFADLEAYRDWQAAMAARAEVVSA